MEKNYYDILEINQNASPEIIEKAYKTLVKKYHPDLQQNHLKKEAEEILKKINEAYDILSNTEKKKAYDASLIEKNQENLISEKYQEMYIENKLLKQKLENLQNQQNQTNIPPNINPTHTAPVYSQDFTQDANQRIEQAVQKAYHDAYIQDLKRRGFKIKYKKTWKDYLKGGISLLIVLAIWFILWQIPFVRNYFLDNPVIQHIINAFTHT